MPLADEDAYVLLAALEASLLGAGYADVADQIRRVANEPLQLDELDDDFDEALAASAVSPDEFEDEMEGPGEDDLLSEPTAGQRLSAAIKLVDLMVTEPLRIEQELPAMSSRAGLDVSSINVGEGAAAVSLRVQGANAVASALDAWTAVLSDLRQALAQ